MAIWCDINGKIKIHKDKHISISKLLNDIIPDIETLNLSVDKTTDYYFYPVRASFPADGLLAHQYIIKLSEKIKQLNASMDIEVNTRWVV